MYTALTRDISWRAWMLALVLALPLLTGPGARAATAPPTDWWVAIRNDDVSAVQAMLLRHVDPQSPNFLGNPALIQAARDQSWQVFDLLARAPGVEVDQANPQDETALMYLCILGQTQRAIALIEAGAQVNRLGWTPLHYAASKAQVETARMLIERGAIINAPGPDGTTPLMMAALSGSEAMVRLLMAHGADPTMFNTAHETAADWARKRNNRSLATRLDEAAAALNRERHAQAGGQSPAPAPAVQGSGGPTPDAQDPDSFSRYFDLGRFEDAPVGR